MARRTPKEPITWKTGVRSCTERPIFAPYGVAAVIYSPALIFSDALITPVFGAVAADAAASEPFLDPVNVSFDFPDGVRRETAMTYDDAERMVRKDFPHLFSATLKEWDDVRFWTFATLLELRLDFQEKVSGEHDENVDLTHVGGYSGNWRYDPRDGRGLQEDLRTTLGGARFIRFQCPKCTRIGFVESASLSEADAEDATDQQASLSVLRDSAEPGNREAQWSLYLDGGRRREDWGWLCKAARQRHVKALVEVGDILWEGREEVSQDRVRAYVWYKAAESAGYERARSEMAFAEWVMPDEEIAAAEELFSTWKPEMCEALLLESHSSKSEPDP